MRSYQAGALTNPSAHVPAFCSACPGVRPMPIVDRTLQVAQPNGTTRACTKPGVICAVSGATGVAVVQLILALSGPPSGHDGGARPAPPPPDSVCQYACLLSHHAATYPASARKKVTAARQPCDKPVAAACRITAWRRTSAHVDVAEVDRVRRNFVNLEE